MSRIHRIRNEKRRRAIVGWTIFAVNIGFVVLNVITGNVSQMTVISAASAILVGLIVIS